MAEADLVANRNRIERIIVNRWHYGFQQVSLMKGSFLFQKSKRDRARVVRKRVDK